MAFANITVTGSISNVTVSEDLTNVSVSSTLSNVVVGQTSTVSNSVIRSAISNTIPITYNSSSGVIGLDPVTTMSDIVLPKLADNTVTSPIYTRDDISSTSGNISADSLTANVTNEAFTGNVNASFLNVTVVDKTTPLHPEDIPFGNANVKRISHLNLDTKYFANSIFRRDPGQTNIYQTQYKLKDNQDFKLANANGVNNPYYRGKTFSTTIFSVGDRLPVNLESPDKGYYLRRFSGGNSDLSVNDTGGPYLTTEPLRRANGQYSGLPLSPQYALGGEGSNPNNQGDIQRQHADTSDAFVAGDRFHGGGLTLHRFFTPETNHYNRNKGIRYQPAQINAHQINLQDSANTYNYQPHIFEIYLYTQFK